MKHAYLDLSTGHLSRETFESLGQFNHLASYEYGEILYVSNTMEDHHPHAPDDLKRLNEFARQQGCQLIRLDQDGDVIDDLPHYAW